MARERAGKCARREGARESGEHVRSQVLQALAMSRISDAWTSVLDMVPAMGLNNSDVVENI